MDVILLEKVQNLGNLGDKVSVRPGYGRNYLVPGGKAVLATPENLAEFEARRAELEKAEAEALTVARKRADALAAVVISIAHRAGDEGKLFGSVGTVDIAQAINDAGVAVEKSEIRLPDGALRQVGEFEVGVHLHTDVDATVKVTIVAES